VTYSASPTPNAWVGQGAAFFAKGTIGQYVIIVPGERLVIVRLGRSPNWPPEVDGVFHLVKDVVAATAGKAKLAGGN
jgi:CubicO group peptidase (beta-lactamase class C family)